MGFQFHACPSYFKAEFPKNAQLVVSSRELDPNNLHQLDSMPPTGPSNNDQTP